MPAVSIITQRMTQPSRPSSKKPAHSPSLL
jgi:hypothetical protein